MLGHQKKYLRTQVLGPSNYYPRNQVLGPLNYYLRFQVLGPLNDYLRNQVLRPSIYYPKTTSRTRANFPHYRNSSVAILINYSSNTSEIRVTFPHYRNSIVGILKPLSQYHHRNSSVRKLNLVSQNCFRNSCEMPPIPNFTGYIFEFLKRSCFFPCQMCCQSQLIFFCPRILLNLYNFCWNILCLISKSQNFKNLKKIRSLKFKVNEGDFCWNILCLISKTQKFKNLKKIKNLKFKVNEGRLLKKCLVPDCYALFLPLYYVIMGFLPSGFPKMVYLRSSIRSDQVNCLISSLQSGTFAFQLLF